MKHFRHWTALLLAAALLLSSAGCLVKEEAEPTTAVAPSDSSQVAASPKRDRSAIAVTLGDIEITAGEIEDSYSSYMQMLSYYGMSAPTDDASIREYRQMIVEDLITQQLPVWKAAQLGITLTADELAAIDTAAHRDADAEYEDLLLSYASYFTDAGEVEKASDLTEEQLNETLEYLNADVREYYDDDSADIDVYIADAYDTYYRDGLVEAYADKLRETISAGVTPDEETVEAWYADTLASQQELLDADPTAYRDLRDALTADPDAEPILYVPEGLAAVRWIAVSPDGSAPDAIAENEATLLSLEAEYGKLALTGGDEARMAEIAETYATLLAETETARDAYYGAAEQQANALYARLESGEDFASVASAEGTDGVTVSAVTEDWIALLEGEDYEFGEALQTAAKTLADGSYSALVQDGETYYIVYMVGRLTAGAVDRIPIENAIRTAALDAATESVWDENVEAWRQEAFAAAVYHEEAYDYVGR